MSAVEARSGVRRKLGASLLVLMLLLSTVIFVSSAPEEVEAARAGIFHTEGGWSVEVVDGEGITGIQSSLAIDDFGHAHIAYRNYDDSTLRYATNAEGFWNITIVDTEVSVDDDSEISLALDSQNKVHICYMSYYNSEDENLIYATNAGGSWAIKVVDTHYQAGYYNDIFVDESDHVHIAYSVQNEGWDTDLKYANNTAGTWVNETADSGVEVGMYPSIVVDDYGIIHIVYFNQDAVSLMWGHKHSGVWFRSPLDDSGDCGTFTSMDITDGTDLHVSYFDEGADDLKYLHFDGIQWDLSPTVVDSEGDVGRYSSICVGSENDPYIAYFDGTNYALKVASLQDGSWNVATVDDAGESEVGSYCSIAISRDGKLGVSNYFGGSDDLLYTSQNAWIIEKLAGTNDNRCVGNTDIVLDDDNNAYISYTANAEYELWFATNSWGSWRYTMIDNTTGGFGGRTSIALGPDNQVHIAYYAPDSGEIRHATKIGGGPWTWEKIADTKPNYGPTDLSMKIDSNGKAHIAYSFLEDDGFASSLRYANNTGGSWVNETIDDSSADIGLYPSLVIDSSDKVYISYVDRTNKNLRCTYKIAGDWAPWTVDSSGTVGDQTSLTIDDANHLHISYMDVTNHDLKYAYFTGGSWLTYTVDTQGWVGEDSSIGVDSDGKVHISYSDTTNSDLKYANGGGSSWSITTLDYTGMVGEETSLAVGTDDKVHIAYEDSTNTQIGYGTNSPWRFDTLMPFREPLVGDGYVSLARDPQGGYHMCFYDEVDDALRYATNTPMGWSTALVDFDFGTGKFCNIAADANGKVHISYYDETNEDLIYATNIAGVAFAKTVVDSVGTVGMYTSIALDAQGYAHIAYFDSSNERLKYATNSGGSWTNETVDDDGIAGLYTDIALDSEGNVHMSYYTGTVGLRYANNTAGSWNAITVDAGNTGLFTSIALDDDDRVHISYYEPLNQDLRYALIDGTSVFKEIVDGSGFGFMARSSIDVDVAGQPHIGYYSEIDGNLRYATKAGDFWWSTTVDVAGNVGKPNSLHVNDRGVVTICYMDITDSKFKIAMQKAEPSAPRDLTLNAIQDEVEVSWSAPMNNNGYAVEGYILEHTYPNGEVEVSIGLNDLGRTDSFLAEGVHKYRVAAYNPMGIGPYCAEEQVTVNLEVIVPPGAPTGVNGYPHNDWTEITWTAPSNNGGSSITNYKVYRGNASDDLILWSTLGNVTTYSDYTVDNGHIYYYAVSAVNSAGEGPQSSVVSVTPGTWPSAPRNLTATLDGNDVILTWEAPEDNGGSPVTNYTIYSGTISGDLEYLRKIGNLLTYTDTMYLPDTTFYYQVTATNAFGESDRSNEVSSDPDLPSSPTLSAEAAGTTVTLTWTAPDEGSSAITNYRVYRGADSGSLSLLTELGNVTSYVDTTGVAGEAYVYQVSAVNGQGEGPRSNTVAVLLGSVPSAPVLEASAEGEVIVITWEEPTDDGGWSVTGYKVYRGTSASNMTLKDTLGIVLNYTDYDVAAGVTYYYAVSALNELGEGIASSVVSIEADSLPSAPTGLEAEAGDATVVLSWNAPANDGGSPITGYVIYRGTTEGAVSTVLVTLGNVTTYTDDDVVNGQTYWYKVSAINDVGQGTTTDVVDATPNTDAGEDGDGSMILIVVAILAIAAVAGVAVFVLRRKK